MVYNCSRCNTPLLDDCLFCQKCGKSIHAIERFCTFCGAKKLKDARFCHKCGNFTEKI